MRNRPENMALRMDQPYESCEALLMDVLNWVDAAIAQAYERDVWVGRDPRLRDVLGLVVTRDEFENALNGSVKPECAGAGEAAELIDEMLRARLALTDPDMPYLRAVNRLGLNEMEEKCLRLALAPEIDQKYEKLYAYLQDDVTRHRPGMLLCAELCASGLTAQAVRRIRNSRGLAVLMDPQDWTQDVLKPCDALLDALFASKEPEKAQESPYVTLHPAHIEQMQRICGEKARIAVLLCGEEGSGRRTALQKAAGSRVVTVKQRDWKAGAAQAALTGGVLCLDAQEGLEIKLSDVPENLYPLFALMPPDAPSGDGMLRLNFEPIGDEAREALFCAHAKMQGVDLQNYAPKLAAKFLFTPGLIAGAMQSARLKEISLGCRLTEQEMHESCYERLPGAQGLTQEVSTIFTLDDLILPTREKAQLKMAVQQVLHRRTVYETWGFGEKTPYGRGVSILLSGPPGTGKTMAARIIAAELHMHLKVVQLSQVISKYIGETEKNLQRVFDQAKLGSQVLFFDECDALFGKRAEVQNAQDRHANAEVAYLLQQMEAHEGVTILATNLSQNIDAAFMRRMRFAIHFPFPDADTRRQLYERMLSGRVPVEGTLDLDFMAQTFEVAGGNIKNIVLRAAFLAASEDTPVAMKHLVRAAVDEQRKNEVVVVRESLREYADFVDEFEEVSSPCQR